MKYADVHAHFYELEDKNAIIRQCGEEGIEFVNTGTNVENNELVVGSKFFALGWWPLESGDFVELRNQVEKYNPVFIGEVGLDYYRVENKAKQAKQFRSVIKLAEEFGKPLVVHSRKAEEDVLKYLKKVNVPVILHSFQGRKDLIIEGVSRGYYFSVPTIALKASNYQTLAKMVPKELLLTESDAPFMGVEFPNTPLSMPLLVDKIEELKGEAVQAQIIKNFKKLVA